ncbi:MAG: AAA family ATPase [Patescibacteria group bacterium]
MKLIIINGPCGVGKSSAAVLLHAQMPMAFHLDIDAQRRFISEYRDKHEESWRLSIAIALNIADTALKAGHDVIVDKMLFDDGVIDRLLAIGRSCGADVYEFILWASKEEVMRRAEVRGYRPGSLFTPEKCERFWYEIKDLKIRRPQAIVIDVEALKTEDVTAELRRQIAIETR